MPSLPFEQTRIAIGMPIGEPFVHWRVMASLTQMEKPPHYGLIIRQGSLVDKNRNEIVQLMLNHPSQFTHLCFLDSDMIYPIETLRRLIEHQLPVVGGICYRKTPPFDPVIFERVQTNAANPTQAQYRPIPLNAKPAPLLKVDACGTGCLVIAREVFEKITPPWFAIQWEGNVQRGEDLYFAERCHQAGISMHVDNTLRITHLTTAGIAPEESFEKGTPQLLF